MGVKIAFYKYKWLINEDNVGDLMFNVDVVKNCFLIWV